MAVYLFDNPEPARRSPMLSVFLAAICAAIFWGCVTTIALWASKDAE
jgi:hypothetical protein